MVYNYNVLNNNLFYVNLKGKILWFTEVEKTILSTPARDVDK
jgi:hypothetical protein